MNAGRGTRRPLVDRRAERSRSRGDSVLAAGGEADAGPERRAGRGGRCTQRKCSSGVTVHLAFWATGPLFVPCCCGNRSPHFRRPSSRPLRSVTGAGAMLCPPRGVLSGVGGPLASAEHMRGPVRRGSDLNFRKKAKSHPPGERGKRLTGILKGRRVSKAAQIGTIIEHCHWYPDDVMLIFSLPFSATRFFLLHVPKIPWYRLSREAGG